MKKYKVIIIDDEPLAIDIIKEYISRFPEFEISKTFTNALDALKFMNDHNIDLVFTDIAMPQISGIELVKLSKQIPQFVMVTSYTNYAIESFELNVIDYLLKPVSFQRFEKTMERFKSQSNKAKTEGNEMCGGV